MGVEEVLGSLIHINACIVAAATGRYCVHKCCAGFQRQGLGWDHTVSPREGLFGERV